MGEDADGEGSSSTPPMSAEFLAALIDHIAHPIFVKDRELRFVLLNRALCELVGYAQEQMLGRTDFDFFPAEEAEFFRKKDLELYATGSQVVIAEEQITDASGRRHVLATTKVPLRDAAGQVTHLVGIIHDITRLKTAEDSLRQINEELESRVRERTAALAAAQEELLRNEKLAVLGRLAGGLAHQIRNPLGIISNASYVLRRALAKSPDPEVEKAVGIINEEVWRANRVITDLIDYARVRRAEPHAADVRQLVERALDDLPACAAIRIAVDIADCPPVLVDFDQAVDALANLLRNAVEAMPRGGTLSIDARPDGDAVLLVIADEGTGIPAEIAARLFEPLVTTKPAGVGLGLTTARALVEAQRGSLTLGASDETGTSFEVRLPSLR